MFEKIQELKEKHNAVILAHYYQNEDIQDIARQTNVKISTANTFLKKSLSEGIIKKVGGFSGHYIYEPVSK